MKYLITIILCLPTLLFSQDVEDSRIKTFSEKFHVKTPGGNTIKITYVRGYKIRKDLPWRQLIQDFTSDMNSVGSSIPPYDDFQVLYIQNEDLQVREIKGKKIYKITSDSASLRTTNLCYLQGRVINIEIEAFSLEELMNTDYESLIAEAVTNYKPGPYLASKSYVSYNIATNTTNRRQKLQNKFNYDVGANWGFLGPAPYLEGFTTASFTRNNRNFYYVKGSIINRNVADSLFANVQLFPMIGYEYGFGSVKNPLRLSFEAGIFPPAWQPSNSPFLRYGASLKAGDRFIVDFMMITNEGDFGAVGFSFGGFSFSTITRF